MTIKEFQQLTSGVVLLDGATGSNLMAAGMPRNVCTEEWVMDHKEVIQDLQRAYLEAGSQILYAPTFGGNRVNLSKHGLAVMLPEVNRRLVEYSREVAGHRALVAGDITTTGKMIDIDDDYSSDDAVEIYREQISALVDAGVDLLVAETMLSIPETVAALTAAREVCALPVMCTVTVDASGNLFMGGNAVTAAKAFEEAGAAAVGVNCSVGPDQLADVVRNIRSAVSVPVIAKPNAGMPTVDAHGVAHYDMGAEEFAKHVKTLVECGATIVGGCCGTTPEFIAAIKKTLS